MARKHFRIKKLSSGDFVIKYDNNPSQMAMVMRLNTKEIERVLSLVFALGELSKEREIYEKAQKVMDKLGI